MAQSSNYIKNVALVGASGRSGTFMAESLLKTGKHVVTALTRADSKSKLVDGLIVKTIDYDNPATIVDALRGQDALVISLASEALALETKLVDAAAEAGVPWVLPTYYCPDIADKSVEEDMFPSFARKRIDAYIEKVGKVKDIRLITGFWYEWSLGIAEAFGFDFAKRQVTLFDEGETKICTSTWPQVGRAVAGILSLKVRPDGPDDSSLCLEKLVHQYVYTCSFTVSQKDMLESVLRVTGTKLEDWKISKEPSRERWATGVELRNKGDRVGMAKAMYTRIFFPDGCGNFAQSKGLSNDALGLPTEEMDPFTQIAIDRSKTSPWGHS